MFENEAEPLIFSPLINLYLISHAEAYLSEIK